MENNQNTNLAPNINSDDSAYDDPRTLEFCFKDDKGDVSVFITISENKKKLILKIMKFLKTGPQKQIFENG